MKLTNEEKTALKSILNICMEQFATSGGDIDYAGFGDDSQTIIRSVLEKLESDEQVTMGEICTTYAPDTDMTFILQEISDENGGNISTECVGWYYGRPDEDLTTEYIGKLKAEYF